MIRKRNNTNGSPRWHHQTSLPLSTLHKQSAKNNHFGIMLLCSVILCVLMLLTTLIFANSHAKSSSSGEISHHSTIKYVDIIGGDTQFYDVIVVGCGPAGIAGGSFRISAWISKFRCLVRHKSVRELPRFCRRRRTNMDPNIN